MLTYTISPVSMAFCGHLGKIQLATIGLAMSVFSVCGMFVILGLLSACDTLFSQVRIHFLFSFAPIFIIIN